MANPELGAILYQLKKQYPGSNATTWSQCSNTGCGKSSRGGAECADCLCDRLLKMGLTHHSINTMRNALQRQAAATLEVEMAFADAHAELK